MKHFQGGRRALAAEVTPCGTLLMVMIGLFAAQFNDTRIIEYLTHQRRLFPALAVTYAMHLSTDALKARFCTGCPALLSESCSDMVGG